MNIINKYWELYEKLGIQASKKGYELGRKTKSFLTNRIKNLIVFVCDICSLALLVKVCLIVSFLTAQAKIFFIIAISNLFIILMARIITIIWYKFDTEL
jgi:hypothetical protein